METKCVCGFKINTEHEQNMFDMYGCARTIKNQANQFSGLSVETCDSQGNPPGDEVQDYEAFKENYIKLLEQNKKK